LQGVLHVWSDEEVVWDDLKKREHLNLEHVTYYGVFATGILTSLGLTLIIHSLPDKWELKHIGSRLVNPLLFTMGNELPIVALNWSCLETLGSQDSCHFCLDIKSHKVILILVKLLTEGVEGADSEFDEISLFYEGPWSP